MKDIDNNTLLEVFFKELRIHQPKFKAKEQVRMVSIIHSFNLLLYLETKPSMGKYSTDRD